MAQILVWLQFKPHYDAEENAGNILATFSTGPAIKNTVSNLVSEILGTFVLILTIFALGLYDLQAGLGTFATVSCANAWKNVWTATTKLT